MERKHINPYKLFFGAFIPNWLLQRTEVSAGAKLCYARLCQYAGNKGYCYPICGDLANKLGISRMSVTRHIGELIDFNLIEKKREQHNNSYFFLRHEWMDIKESRCNKSEHLKESRCNKYAHLYI